LNETITRAGGCIVAARASAAGEIDAAAEQAEIVWHLKDLVRIDTSNPLGNESKVASYVRDVLAKEGIGAAEQPRGIAATKRPAPGD